METEEDIVKFWEATQAFQKSLEQSKNGPDFVFYDGPPFATGKPHYGHIVASTLKDIVPRYWTMMGHHVERKWGWDCHGLPIEYEIEKELGIKTKQEVEAFGIDNYNEACRQIVLRYREDWRKTITRLGRWVDFDNDYKTMDPTFMESVWWVFSQLWKQGRVYQGVKVMPYSTGCQTPLSNFEAKSNYQKVKDPSIIVKFKLLDPEKLDAQLENSRVFFLVWTTTPWTLTCNLAICANKDIKYVVYQVKDEFLILSESSCKTYLKGLKDCKLVKNLTGQDLVGLTYRSLYDFHDGKYLNSHQVLLDSYVKEENGTGLVHQAPAFGEDDFRVCTKAGIIDRDREPPCPIDSQGIFTLPGFEGTYFKDADHKILGNLKDRGKLFRKAQEEHDYPYCWRSDTPLMYRTVKSWFVEVKSLQDELIENNKKVNWVPDFIGKNKFANWLQNTQDWCVSRNRYWGTPLPVWISDDGEEQVCVGSIQELEELAGLPSGTITDLHRHHLDQITIPSKHGKPPLRRVSEVFDCWFESGSMPYGQFHYPFENKEKFEANFPCHFIAEGSDQTRGWFYTLLVLSTALFKRPAYQNVIVNGMVLAEDGQKMSKRKQNYPPPERVLNEYGADALRLYLIDSKVVRADSLKFKEADLRTVVKNVNIMLRNILQYWQETVEFFEYQTKFKWKLRSVIVPEEDGITVSLNDPLDSWMCDCLEKFITNIHLSMQRFDLTPVLDLIETYIDQLSRWYVKLNKDRFRQVKDPSDVENGLSVLYYGLYYYAITMAPFTPFLSEILYQKLKPYQHNSKESVHLERIPTEFSYLENDDMVLSMDYLVPILNMVRTLRGQRQVTSIKMPYSQLTVLHPNPKVIDAVKRVEQVLKNEGNIIEVVYGHDSSQYLSYSLTPNGKLLGRKLGKEIREFRSYLESLTEIQKGQIVEERLNIAWNNHEIGFDELLVSSEPKNSKLQVSSDNQLLILLDPVITPKLVGIYCLKMLTRSGQDYRRSIGLSLADEISVEYRCHGKNKVLTPKFIEENEKELTRLLGNPVNESPHDAKQIGNIDLDFDYVKEKMTLNLYQ